MQRKLKLPVCNERFRHPTIPFFQPLVRPIEEGYWYLAEDYAFCHRARECGYQVFADTSIRLWHIGTHRYGREDAGLERQRFGTFTLNFNDASGRAHDTPTERPPALAIFAAEYPWPSEKPDVASFPDRNRLSPETQELLAASVTPATQLIVEVGSGTGRSTRFLAGLPPRATIIAIVPWEGSPEHRQDPELAPALPRLYEAFLAQSWDYRDQIIPVKASSLEGLERIAEAGLQPDLIHLAAPFTESALTSLVTAALDLFPHAVLVGHDLPDASACQAVEPLAQARHRSLDARSPHWRILPAPG